MNLLIDRQGKQTICTTQHVIQCKMTFGKTLASFLRSGGVRVACYATHLVVECGTALSTQQHTAVNRLLRDGEFYLVHLALGKTYTVKDQDTRPIKRI